MGEQVSRSDANGNSLSWRDELKWRDESSLADELRTRMVRAQRQVISEPVEDEQEYDDPRFVRRPGDKYTYSSLQGMANQQPRASLSGVSVADFRPSQAEPAYPSQPLLSGYISPMLLAHLLVCVLAVHFAYFVIAAVLTNQGTAGDMFAPNRWGRLEQLLACVTGVGFLAWTYRLYANLSTFGALGLKRSPGLAAAYLMIPFANLAMPHVVYGEIWATSDPREAPYSQPEMRRADWDAVTILWWLSFTAAGFISAYSMVLGALHAPMAGYLATLADITFALSALLAIAAVWRLSTRQDDKQLILRQWYSGGALQEQAVNA